MGAAAGWAGMSGYDPSVSGTELVTHESDLGSWTRARRSPDPRLQGLVARDFVGVHQQVADGGRWLQPTVAVVSVIITLEGPLRADERTLPRAWLGGLGGTCAVVETAATHASLDLKLPPLGAYALCGQPLRSLAGEFVELDELFGAAGRRLEERLGDAPDWDARFDVLERFLLDRARVACQPHPMVAAAWSRLHETAGAVRIDALAAELGFSRRHLTMTFHEQVGLAPKAVARLLRFSGVRERLARAPDRWADIAYAAGYCDQAHLNRDFRQLAGTTPSDFLASLRDDRATAGGITFVQDKRPGRHVR
jgi:AraC-like DNA-binding protein